MKRLFALSLFFLYPNLWSNTNLGTILTVQKGLATVKECQRDGTQTGPCPKGDPMEGLQDILNFATTNQCLAGEASFQNAGIDVPECPDGFDDLKGLDNTYPSSGIFAIYSVMNRNFLYDLVSSYLKDNPVGRFNLVLPLDMASHLQKDSELLEVLNSPRVNIINVATMPSVGMWIQDGFQFATLKDKPAIYQTDHRLETGSPLKDRIACQVAKQCNLPYFVPSDLIDLEDVSASSLNAGGNLEVLPGGTFIMGTRGNTLTEVQETYKKSLEQSGNKVLELDTGFLFISHIDEIVSIIKTVRPAPCNYAVMMSSPDKAFELLEQTVESENYPFPLKKSEPTEYPMRHEEMPDGGKKYFMDNGCELRCHPSDFPHDIGFRCTQFCPSLEDGEITPESMERPFFNEEAFGQEGRVFEDKSGVEYGLGRCTVRCYKERNGLENTCLESCENYDSRCDSLNFYKLMDEGVYREVIKDKKVNNIYNQYCVDGHPLESFVASDEYRIIKQQKGFNEEDSRSRLQENKEKLIRELKSSTKCDEPPVIEMPVFFRHGVSYLPNVVNSVVETPSSESASKVILPRTYFKPFDDYVKNELEKYGVGSTFIHDLEYHLGFGEVHCGTNEARICR